MYISEIYWNLLSYLFIYTIGKEVIKLIIFISILLFYFLLILNLIINYDILYSKNKFLVYFFFKKNIKNMMNKFYFIILNYYKNLNIFYNYIKRNKKKKSNG